MDKSLTLRELYKYLQCAKVELYEHPHADIIASGWVFDGKFDAVFEKYLHRRIMFIEPLDEAVAIVLFEEE